MSPRPRTFQLLVLTWVLLVVAGAIASILPLRALCPEIGLCAALYLGMSAGRPIPGAATTAFSIGYVTDLLAGAPKGTFALTFLAICTLTRIGAVHIDVRGPVRMAGFVAVASLVSGTAVVLLRATVSESIGLEALVLVPLQAAVNAVFAPAIMSALRRAGGPITGSESDAGRLRLGGMAAR